MPDAGCAREGTCRGNQKGVSNSQTVQPLASLRLAVNPLISVQTSLLGSLRVSQL